MRAGFTLLELLVVLSILAIVLGIAMPRVDVEEAQLRAATQSVGSTLLLAQRTAVTRQHDVVIAFDETRRVIRMHEDTNNNGVIDEDERVVHVALDDAVIFGLGSASPREFSEEAIGFTGEQDGLPAMKFHRDGSASEHGGFYLTSKRSAMSSDYAKDTRAVEITRATGRASWFRYSATEWHRGF